MYQKACICKAEAHRGLDSEDIAIVLTLSHQYSHVLQDFSRLHTFFANGLGLDLAIALQNQIPSLDDA